MPSTTLDRDEIDTDRPLRFLTAKDSSATRVQDALEADAILPSPTVPAMQPKPKNGRLESTMREVPGVGNDIDISPLIRLSRPKVLPRRLAVLQSWEAAVTDIDDGVLWAELRDLTKPANPPEEAELSLDNFSVADRALLRIGSVFYWIVGYQTSPGGQITNVSELRLRRTPQWSQYTIDSIQAKAAELFRELTRNDEK